MPTDSTVPRIVTAEWQVDQVLRDIGISREIVRLVAFSAAGARADASPHDPLNSAGTFSYIHGVRAIRDNLVPLGWRLARDGNVECTVHDELGVQCVFQNVHNACGEADPIAISDKGPGARKLVRNGRQGEFWGEVLDIAGSGLGRTPTVWLICVSADEHSIRAEVSCPEIFEGNQFDGFVHRLFVVDESLGPKPTPRTDSDDDAFDLDIRVTKK